MPKDNLDFSYIVALVSWIHSIQFIISLSSTSSFPISMNQTSIWVGGINCNQASIGKTKFREIPDILNNKYLSIQNYK